MKGLAVYLNFARLVLKVEILAGKIHCGCW